MTQMALHFVDPTIPGLSGRDLIRHGINAIQSVGQGRDQGRDQGRGQGRGWLSSRRWDLALRRSLDQLDTHLLRDLGYDRDAS